MIFFFNVAFYMRKEKSLNRLICTYISSCTSGIIQDWRDLRRSLVLSIKKVVSSVVGPSYSGLCPVWSRKTPRTEIEKPPQITSIKFPHCYAQVFSLIFPFLGSYICLTESGISIYHYWSEIEPQCCVTCIVKSSDSCNRMQIPWECSE